MDIFTAYYSSVSSVKMMKISVVHIHLYAKHDVQCSLKAKSSGKSMKNENLLVNTRMSHLIRKLLSSFLN